MKECLVFLFLKCGKSEIKEGVFCQSNSYRNRGKKSIWMVKFTLLRIILLGLHKTICFGVEVKEEIVFP